MVDTSGVDFVFSDRRESFQVLANSLEKRHMAWKQGKSDRNLLPVSFLADGPGSGKSRYLQDLSSSFIEFVRQNEWSYPEDFEALFE